MEIFARVQSAVVVTGELGELRYANAYAVKLFGLTGEIAKLAGTPLHELGFEDGDERRAAELTRQALRGKAWEGTFLSRRPDDSLVFVRAQALPLRARGGSPRGVVIIAREATRHGSQRERDRIGLLERIGERLAGSLQLDTTLRHVTETLVPQFADHCFIDLFKNDKLIRRVQTHAGGWTPAPGTWVPVGEQISYPKGHFCEQAMTRKETVVVSDLSEDVFPAPSSASLRTSDDIGMTSVVAAPLIARGELLGVMSLALSHLTDREDRHYDSDDRDFLGAIAGRIAIAIDNAMLFEEERRTALAFQTSLLPQTPPELDGLEIAYKYVPAKPLETHGQGIQTQVGGDWYDIIPLSAGRVGIVIGDVEGRGARAAAIMGQLRAALRAFAQDDKSPAEILRRLDDWVRMLTPVAETPDSPGADPPTVSCTYLVYDAWSRELCFANAGHDAPLLISKDGVEQLEIQHEGLLLGVRGKGIGGSPVFVEEAYELAAGDTLIFYTDGLTDRRHRADGNGHYTEAESLQMLRESVEAARDGSVKAIAQAAEEAVPGEIDDDMAIVVVRTSPVNLAAWEYTFPAEPIRVSEARRLAQEIFLSWGMEPSQADLTCLLVSEVVTNVVLHAAVSATPRHEFVFEPSGSALPEIIEDWSSSPFSDRLTVAAGKEFTLRLRRGQASVWVEVIDADLRLPRIRSAGETDEGGRGLYLVDQLASRWGSRPTSEGKAVWFEMPLRESASG
jgi:PAS domain S-box-containing protein